MCDQTANASDDHALLNAIAIYCASFTPPRSPDLYMAFLLNQMMSATSETAARDICKSITQHLEDVLSNPQPDA